MSKSLSARRLAENEAYFRDRNQAIESGLKHIKRMAVAHDQKHFVNDDDLELQFFCECSDENCRERLRLRRSQYDVIHKANDRFVVVCGHEVQAVERVIEKTDAYCVIQKRMEPPKTSSRLNPTPIANR